MIYDAAGAFAGRVPFIMPNILRNTDNGSLPSEYPIYPGNPPDLTRADPLNPRHPRSILPQNEFASSTIPVPSR